MTELICYECGCCKTRVFRNIDDFYEWIISKSFAVSDKITRVISKKIKKDKQVRIYWCSERQKGPYLKIEEIPVSNCRRLKKSK